MSATGYGVRAKRPIAVDEVMCRVNASVAMNEQQASRSAVAPIIRQMYIDHRTTSARSVAW